jgi:hypothetical protein
MSREAAPPMDLLPLSSPYAAMRPLTIGCPPYFEMGSDSIFQVKK